MPRKISAGIQKSFYLGRDWLGHSFYIQGFGQCHYAEDDLMEISRKFTREIYPRPVLGQLPENGSRVNVNVMDDLKALLKKQTKEIKRETMGRIQDLSLNEILNKIKKVAREEFEKLQRR